MKFICSSLGCDVEKPVGYCKECSHANWIVNRNITFNPHFGPHSKKNINWRAFNKWFKEFENIDIGETSFAQED